MRIPDRKLVKLYFGYGTLLYVQFFFVYGSTNWISSERSIFFSYYFSWEQDIPFIPIFILPYLSLSLFIILPVFFIDANRIMPWAVSHMIMTFAAGLIFLLAPSKHAMSRINDKHDFSYLFDLLYTLDLPYNLFPSLHVALSTLAFLIMLPLMNRKLIIISIATWWSVMTASVIFIHQHNVSDIVGGIILSWLCYRYIYCKAVSSM